MTKRIPTPTQSAALSDKSGRPSTHTYRWMDSVTSAVDELEGGKAAKTQAWEQSFFIEYPANQDYKVVIKASLARTITNVVTQLAAGTCSLTVKRDATGLGTAIAVTTTEADTAYTTNNVLAVGQDIVFTVANASTTAQRLSVTLYGTLTLS